MPEEINSRCRAVDPRGTAHRTSGLAFRRAAGRREARA